MPNRLTKIYTRTGDEGYTMLGGNRLSKDDLLVDASGSIDELNSMIGFVLAHPIEHPSITRCLVSIQHQLFDIGAELHMPEHTNITDKDVINLETILDSFNEKLPPLKEFILPGGNLSSASCHLARTVCRRAERVVVKLHRKIPLHNPQIIKYLNRLSDLLFVIARVLARASNQDEPMWEHDKIKQ